MLCGANIGKDFSPSINGSANITSNLLQQNLPSEERVSVGAAGLCNTSGLQQNQKVCGGSWS